MSIDDLVLRKMDHATWLSQFGLTLKETRIKRGQVVTPFLLGAITRLEYAARYIELLEADIRRLRRLRVVPGAEETSGFDPAHHPPPSFGYGPQDGYTTDEDPEEKDAPQATMWIGATDPYGDLPGGRGWEPYNREKADAARMRGELVTINVRVPNGRK